MGLMFLLTRTEFVFTLGPRYILPILWHWNSLEFPVPESSALALHLINEKERVPWKNGPGTSEIDQGGEWLPLPLERNWGELALPIQSGWNL